MRANKEWNISRGQWAIVAISLSLLLTAVVTEERYTAFFGASHRNNGAITYLALAGLSFTAMMSFSHQNVWRLRQAIVLLGMVLTIYGYLQLLKHDFFHWVLLYNPVILTLGNPDFSSALLGACAITTLWMAIDHKNRWVQVGGGLLVIVEVVLVRKTGSVQGLLAFLFGVSLIIGGKLWQWRKRIGQISFLLAGLLAVAVLLGLLNKGPLASLIYRSSLNNRLDYWKAAFEMFKARPFAGVGFERFGENYGRYAPQIQVVQGQTTDNAHSVFLQLLATGGLLVFIPYIILLVIICMSSFKALRRSSGREQLNLIALLAVWSSLLLISAISIDNLGVTVWFWIIGGSLYALSQEALTKEPKLIENQRKKVPSGKREVKSFADNTSLAPLVSLGAVVLTFLLIFPGIRTSKALFDLSSNKTGLDKARYLQKIIDTSQIKPRSAQVYISLADVALRVPDLPTAASLLREASKMDPKSINGIRLNAIAHEVENNFALAIPFRVQLLSLDPWTTSNRLQLIKDYLGNHQINDARLAVQELVQLYPVSEDAKAAALLLKG